LTESGFNDDDVCEWVRGCAILDDLLEKADELDDVLENGGDITGSDVTDGLLDEWEGVGDVSDALWVNAVMVEVVLVANAIGNGLLDEGEQFGEISDDLGEITRLDIVDDLWDEADKLGDVIEALVNIVSLEFWESGSSTIFGDLLESSDELHDVTEDLGDITRGDVVDSLLNEWEGVGDILDAFWGDTVGLQSFFGLGAIRDGLLDEGDQFGEISHHFRDIARADVVDKLWNEGDKLVDVVEALCDVI
jgi:uncharacterized protein (DUF433 family)